MRKKIKTISWTNYLIILITFALFAVAIFTKGLTRDILLEAAIFLVSVKLILTTFQIKYLTAEIIQRLDAMQKAIKEK